MFHCRYEYSVNCRGIMTGFSDSILTACLCILNSIAFLSTNSDGCPEACVCSPSKKLGGVSVQCSRQSLDIIPTEYPVETSEIILHGNNINLAPSDETVFSSLHNLRRLDLSFNKINYIPFACFPDHLKHLNLSHNSLKTVDFQPPKLLRILDLSHNRFSEIRNAVFSTFPVLNTLLLNVNLLTFLSKEMFGDNEYEMLEKLSIAGNKIKTIEDGAFNSLKKLQALNLASNMISSLSNSTFIGLDSLEFLDASNNKISHVESGTFKHLQSIKYLYLKSNRLKNVPHGVPMAEWLDISDNLISQINETEKESLYTSEFFNLANNPLHCDCKLLWLKELWDRREHKVKHFDQPANFIPKCETPEILNGEPWDQIGDSMFSCENDTESTVSQVEDLNLDDFKNEVDRMLDKQGTLDIRPVLINVTTDIINISWELLEGFIFESGSLEVYYHKFGDLNNLRYIILTMESDYVTIKDLIADTPYVICIDLVHKSKDLSTPLSQCIEVTTSPLPYVFTINISMIVSVNALILKILGSIIFAVSFVGFVAVILGAVTAQTKSWSSDLSEHDLTKLVSKQEELSDKSPLENVENSTVTKTFKIE